MEKIVKVANSMKKIAEDDPRRVIHSLKVGVTVTLVSLFYYSQPLYSAFGTSALWAVLTVVIIFEFTVGATLGKGLNRAIATVVAGALGIGAHGLASRCGKIGEPLLIGFFVFLQASGSTFLRFFPKVKARYDYGCMVFVLTFAFISMSGFRGDEIVALARQKLATSVLGALGSLLISVLIFPVWAGEDLHNLVATNMQKLGDSLEGFGIAYFKVKGDYAPKGGISMPQTYQTVLNTTDIEETLANFATWEPCHGRFRHNHPWNQYLKLGRFTQECAYKMDALNAHLKSDNREPTKFREEIREECNTMTFEASKTLKELAIALNTMIQPSSCKDHVARATAAVKSLKNLLTSSSLWEDSELLLKVIPSAAVASILMDIVGCIEKMVECTNELAALAHFKTVELEKPQSRLKKNGVFKKLESITNIFITGGSQDQDGTN